jgi:hypothetical protein
MGGYHAAFISVGVSFFTAISYCVLTSTITNHIPRNNNPPFGVLRYIINNLIYIGFFTLTVAGLSPALYTRENTSSMQPQLLHAFIASISTCMASFFQLFKTAGF